MNAGGVIPSAALEQAAAICEEISRWTAGCSQAARGADPAAALAYLVGALPRVHHLARQAQDLYGDHYAEAFEAHQVQLAGEFGARAMAEKLAMRDIAPLLEVHLRAKGTVCDLEDLFQTVRTVAGAPAAPSGHKRTFS